MTAVGKILVFVNLLFSLVVGGFIIMVYIARTNWAENYKNIETRYKALAAEADTIRAETQEMRTKIAQEMDGLKAANKKLTDDMAAKDAELKAVNTQLAAEREKTVTGDATSTSVLAQSQRREEEIKRYETEIKKLNDKLNASISDQTKLRDRAVAADIENNSLKNRNKQLVDQLEDMGKENIRLRNVGGSAAGTSTVTAKNPPLENIEGIVTKMDTQSGLVTLSIGSDAGLTKGHTLEIFRLNPAKYLGTVRIVEVTPHEAVARPVSRTSSPVQQGDRVASKILGS
jgi:myosin heavy subunit